MQVKSKYEWDLNPTSYTIEEACRVLFTSSSYFDEGQLESLRSELRELQEFNSKLLALLHEHNCVPDALVLQLLDTYEKIE